MQTFTSRWCQVADRRLDVVTPRPSFTAASCQGANGFDIERDIDHHAAMRAAAACAMHILRADAQRISRMQHFLTSIAQLHQLTGFHPHDLSEIMSVDKKTPAPGQVMTGNMHVAASGFFLGPG